MKSSVFVMFLKILNVILMSESASLTTEDYAHLISDVHKNGKSTFASLMYFDSGNSHSQKNLIFNIQVLLSKEKIMSSTFELQNQLFLKKGRSSILMRMKDVRITRVIFLMSESDLIEMQKLAGLPDRNEIINLIIFIETQKTPSPEFCMNPEGNPFRLDAGVSLLVKCYDNIMIREWHSQNQNRMSVHNRATWAPGTGLHLSSRSLVLDDFVILKGKVLHSIFYKPMSAPLIEYVRELCHVLELGGNFTIVKSKEVAGSGQWNESIQAWDGVIGQLSNDNFDMAMGLFSVDSARSSVIDSSEILYRTDQFLIFKQPKAEVVVSWFAFFKPFTFGLWSALILSLLVVLLTHIFIKLMELRRDHNDDSSIVQDFLYIWGMYCQQSSPEIPNVPSLKILYCSILFFTSCIFIIFSAGFVCDLTITDLNLPFRSMEELARVKSHKLIVASPGFIYKFENANDSTWNEIHELMVKQPNDNEETMRMICNENVAMFTSLMYWTSIHKTSKSRCPMMKIATDIHEFPIFFLRKNSRYTKGINYILQKLRSVGILKRLKSLYYKAVQRIPTPDSFENTYGAVGIMDTAMPLAILFGGIIFSVLMLVTERMIHWFWNGDIVNTVNISQPFML